LAITKHPDVKVWAAITTVATLVLLVTGRYRFIETFVTLLVAAFTFGTVANVIALQAFDDWAGRGRDLVNGLSFHLPPAEERQGLNPLATALATFGIIGVGANELISYPYFCVEKGYARFTGPRDSSAAWADRANGWLRVLRWDAWCSMVVYTLATLAFYFLGAAVLGRIGLVPENDDLIRTLLVMYEPVFGAWALWLFLFGAFAVLYSTFFVANAGHARTVTDAIFVLSGSPDDPWRRGRLVKLFCVILPTIALGVFVLFPNPVQLVLLSGAMQAVMLPMLSATAIYFRYRRCDERVMPGKLWDTALWLSAAGMLVAGGYLVIMQLPKWRALLGG
jgi:Mn2+/Fe2+ NRAMP family transporter